MKRFVFGLLILALSGCGVAYVTPQVRQGVASSSQVRVLPVTAESVLQANASTYYPQSLPAAFSQTVSAGSTAGFGTTGLPTATANRPDVAIAPRLRIPPPLPQMPYEIGVGDVLSLVTPTPVSAGEELSGLLTPQSRRQGYTVQDDGAIVVPDVGRILVAGLTLEEAETEVFQSLVSAQIDPTFSLEVAEFNSARVSIGGAVRNPGVAPITQIPLRLGEALAQVGGVETRDRDNTALRLFRDGQLYEIPINDFYRDPSLQQLVLADGDSVFVDTSSNLDQAETYFRQQIQLFQARQSARSAALSALQSELNIRRGTLDDQRGNFQARLALGAVERNYVYVTGEVNNQGRVALPFETRASLADILFGEAGGVPTKTGNPGKIYVLRGNADSSEFPGITAWHLDGQNAANLVLATRLEMRPNDVIFVAEQPITRWNRLLSQVIPSLITSGANAVLN